MKLSTINISEWVSVVNNITFQEDNELKRQVLENVLSVIYWKNYNRSFRAHLTSSWKEFLQWFSKQFATKIMLENAINDYQNVKEIEKIKVEEKENETISD